ncbi:MAG TPA: N-acetylmuramoyl-L-alanine amidase [Gemmatimonadaceae bacterium]
MRSSLVGVSVLLAACATATPATKTAPAPAPASRAEVTSMLPPIPLVTGALKPTVVYPVANSFVEARDSNFIFGSVGNGRAQLWINGAAVPVSPNGAFLAWLPVPAVDSPRYEIVAVAGTDTARLEHPVRLRPPVLKLATDGPLAYDTASLSPGSRLALRDDDTVRVTVRSAPNASVVWRSDLGATQALSASGTLFSVDLPARMLRARTELVLMRRGDTIHVALPPVGVALSNQWEMLGPDSVGPDATDEELIGRPIPSGTYKWFLLPGTALEVTGRNGDYSRVRLDSQLEVWVSTSDLHPLPSWWLPTKRVAGNARLVSQPEWVDLVVPMAGRPPYYVDEGAHELTVTLYGTMINTDIVNYGGNDSLVREAKWTQDASDRGHFTLQLSSPAYGYLAFWQNGAFILRVRRPPRIDSGSPLKGLTIAIDPGHPPIGATGPTGLYEPVPTLAVGLLVRQMLEARGAKVVMTRTTADPVALGDRPIIARKANANALVSIHLNALPDGINPFTSNGTGAYYFRSQSLPLARELQRAMVARMGLRNLGINYDNLRLARPTWMPAVLCEGAFLMIPEQENALRTPEFQKVYATAIVDGLESYFRSLPAR